MCSFVFGRCFKVRQRGSFKRAEQKWQNRHNRHIVHHFLRLIDYNGEGRRGARLAIKAAGIVTKHVEVKEQSCCIWQNMIPAAAAAAAFGALQCLYTGNQGSNKIQRQPQATHGGMRGDTHTHTHMHVKYGGHSYQHAIDDI